MDSRSRTGGQARRAREARSVDDRPRCLGRPAADVQAIPQPRDHGFEHWFSTQNNAVPTHENPRNFVRNGTPLGVQEGYSSHIVAKEAIRWLKDDRARDKPFFMYICFHEPHEVIASAPEYMSQYSDLPLERREHHANITQMDAAVGKILAALDEGGYRDNTLVVFTSDNGPARTPRHPFGSAGPQYRR